MDKDTWDQKIKAFRLQMTNGSPENYRKTVHGDSFHR